MGTVLAAGQSPATLGMLRHCLVGLLQYRRSFCSPDTPHPKGTAGGITAPVISLSREIKNVQLLKADAQFLNGLKLFYLWLISIRKWSTCKSHMGPEQCTWQISTCSGWLPLTAGIHSFHTSQALIYSLLLLSNGVGVNQKQNLSVAAGNKKGCVWRQTGQNADQQQQQACSSPPATSSCPPWGSNTLYCFTPVSWSPITELLRFKRPSRSSSSVGKTEPCNPAWNPQQEAECSGSKPCLEGKPTVLGFNFTAQWLRSRGGFGGKGISEDLTWGWHSSVMWCQFPLMDQNQSAVIPMQVCSFLSLP